jgi:hypothetical protein
MTKLFIIFTLSVWFAHAAGWRLLGSLRPRILLPAARRPLFATASGTSAVASSVNPATVVEREDLRNVAIIGELRSLRFGPNALIH